MNYHESKITMEPLDKMYILVFLMKKMKHNTKEQVPMTVVPILKEQLGRLKQACNDNSGAGLYIGNLFIALMSLDNSNLSNMTQEMKQIICDGLYEIKMSLCEETFQYYLNREFEVTSTSEDIMRDVVREVLG